jgi:hypothetical protein
MKKLAASARWGCAALACALLAGAPAFGQAAGVRIVPGFEKVYGDLKKKEAEQQKEFARADTETAAAETLRLQGEKLMADSDALIGSHKVAYQTLAAQIGAAASGDAVRAEAKALEDLSKLWSRAEEDRDRGEKMIRASQKDMLRAEDRRTKASRKLAEIRAAMTRTYDMSGGAYSSGAAPAGEAASSVKEGAVAPAAEAIAESPLPPLSEGTASAPADNLDAELLGGAAQEKAGAPLKSD